MKVRATSGSLWKLSYPIIVAGIGETIIDVTDVIFLGHYGVTELGAVALADALYELTIVFGVGLAEAVQVVVARRSGEGARAEAGRAFGQGLYLLAINAAVVLLVVKFLSPFLTGWIVSSDEIRAAADAFLQIIAFSVLFDSMNFAYGAFYVGISRTRVLIGATAVLALTNVVLDYGLIFGNLGLPELGIEGAALASVTAEAGTFVFLTAYAWVVGDIAGYGLFSFARWNRRMGRALLGIASPVAVEGLVETARWFLFFVIVERLGELALAGSTVIYSCYIVLLIPVEGVAEGLSSMVSNLIGQGKSARIGLLVRRAMTMGSLVTVPLLLLAFLFPRWVLSLFTSDAATIEAAVASLMVASAAVLIAVPGEVLLRAVYGTADTQATLGIEIVNTTAVLAFAFLAAQLLGLPMVYVWLSLIVGWLIRAGLSWAWLRSQIWKRLEI